MKTRFLMVALVVIAIAPPIIIFDYFLPSGRVVNVVGTETKYFEANAGDGGGQRDVRFIAADDADTQRTRMYRNEDALFYLLKVDSADIQAVAQSVERRDQTALVRYYGWRFPFLDMFPNVLTIREVPANYVYVPYAQYIVYSAYFLMLALGGWTIRKRLRARAARRAEREQEAEETRMREQAAQQRKEEEKVDQFLSNP